MDQKGSAAILALQRWGDVTPEVSRRNPLYAGNEACKQGIHPGQTSEVPVAPQKGLMSSKN